jgi:cell division protein FtsX
MLVLVAGVVIVIVGAVLSDVTYAIGGFVVGALNSTGNVRGTLGAIKNVGAVLPPVFTILGVVLTIIAAFLIIRKLLGLTKELKEV